MNYNKNRYNEKIIIKCYYLRESIFLMILDLDNGDKVHANIVNQVGRVLCQVEYHEIEIKSNHTDERKCKSSSECEPISSEY